MTAQKKKRLALAGYLLAEVEGTMLEHWQDESAGDTDYAAQCRKDIAFVEEAERVVEALMDPLAGSAAWRRLNTVENGLIRLCSGMQYMVYAPPLWAQEVQQ